MWYKNRYRRHLTDMHIDDWDESFMSKFCAEEYFDLLKTAHVNSVMIPLVSLVGKPYYPSKFADMHKGFIGKENEMEKLFELCSKSGIAVVTYFSTYFNNWAAKEHPEWRVLDPNGKDRLNNDPLFRYGLCCNQNPGYREYVEKHIAEVAEIFKDKIDGVFYDQLYYEIPCLCKVCRERYQKDNGRPLPKKPEMTNPEWVYSIAEREKWLGEFGAFLQKTHKRYMPDVTFLMNVGGVCADTDKENMWSSGELAKQSDYAAGDIHGGVPEKSVACKTFYNMSKNQPFELMASRAEPNLRHHTVTKTETKLLKYAMISAAHHGATFMIDGIDPDGSFDRRVYERIGNVYRQEEKYEKYFKGDLVGDIGVFYNFNAKSSLTGQSFEPHNCTVNTCLTLAANKIPHGVFTPVNFNVEQYKFLLLPQLRSLNKENQERLKKYLENGGFAYISGENQPDLIKELAGVTLTGITEYAMSYIYPTEKYTSLMPEFNKKFPLDFAYKLPICSVEDAEIIAKYAFPYTKTTDPRFTSIHANPPGITTDIPAIVYKKVGRGGIIWSAVPLEYEIIPDYRQVLLNLIFRFIDKENILVKAKGPEDYELVTFRDGKDLYISVINIANADPVVTIRGFEVAIKYPQPAKVLYLPDETEIESVYKDGRIIFTLRDTLIADMYKITL